MVASTALRQPFALADEITAKAGVDSFRARVIAHLLLHHQEQICARIQQPKACMASSITQAREGKLYLMCGENEDEFQKPNRF